MNGRPYSRWELNPHRGGAWARPSANRSYFSAAIRAVAPGLLPAAAPVRGSAIPAAPGRPSTGGRFPTLADGQRSGPRFRPVLALATDARSRVSASLRIITVRARSAPRRSAAVIGLCQRRPAYLAEPDSSLATCFETIRRLLPESQRDGT